MAKKTKEPPRRIESTRRLLFITPALIPTNPQHKERTTMVKTTPFIPPSPKHPCIPGPNAAPVSKPHGQPPPIKTAPRPCK